MGKSVSVMLGRGSLAHNNRVFSTENVDPALSVNNVIFVQQKLKTAYQEIFGGALERYNEKQKRSDRMIPDYLEHIRQSKNGEKAFHELVVQVGNRNDTGIGTEDAEIAKEILTEYYYEFVERNPNMRVFNAVIHMDEKDGTPHLHIDFIPVATDQKRGLEVKNSMRQALQQQGFDFQTREEYPSYGKKISRIGGGRWLDSERTQLGSVLQQHGLIWEKQDTHREHLTVKEFKACAELINREMQNTPSAELEIREPNTAMRLAGVKSSEIIVSRSSAEAIQQENTVLRTQAEIDRQTIQKMDSDKIARDVSIQRLVTRAVDTDKMATESVRIAKAEADEVKARYSPGTAEKYKELVGKHNQVISIYRKMESRCKTAEEQNQQLPERIETAVLSATNTLQTENNRLRDELERIKQKAAALQDKVHSICQTLYDIMRSVFMLKYSYKDKSPNPYKSELTESADFLIDTLEQKSRVAFLDAGFPDMEKGMSGMSVTAEMEQAVRNRLPKPKRYEYEIGG